VALKMVLAVTEACWSGSSPELLNWLSRTRVPAEEALPELLGEEDPAHPAMSAGITLATPSAATHLEALAGPRALDDM
jgi:hypothetical protein